MDASLASGRRDAWYWWRASVRTLAIVLNAGVFGAALVALAWRFGALAPAVLVVAAIVPLALVLVITEPRIGILVVFASFSIGFASLPFGPLNLQAVDLAIFLVTALVALRRMGAGLVPLRWSPALAWAVALVAWAIVSMTSALDLSEAVKQVGSLAAGAVFATVTYTVCRSMRDIRMLSAGLVFVAAAVTLPALTQMGGFRSYYQGALVEGRLQGIFIEPNELGLFCAMTSLVAAGLFLGTRNRPLLRLAYLFALAILLAGLILSLSRGAWLGAGAGVLLLLWWLRDARRLLIAAAFPLLIGLVALATFAPENPTVRVVEQRLFAFTNIDQPYDERPEIYAEAIRQIRDDPWTGQGPGNFAVASRRSASDGVAVAASHAHNAYLNMGAELGLPSVLLLLGLIGTVTAHARKAIRTADRLGARSDAALIAGLAALLVADVTTGLVNNFLGNAIIEPTIWAGIGMILAAPQALRESNE